MDSEKCRLCLVYHSSNIRLVEKNRKNAIARKIELHIQCEIDQSDILPKAICLLCNKKVNEFHQFYQQVKRTQETFLQSVVKIEAPDDDVVEPSFVECGNAILNQFRDEAIEAENDDVGDGDTNANCDDDEKAMEKTTDFFDMEIPEYFDRKCDFCDATFLDIGDAQTHYLKDHNCRGYLKCCGQQFYSRCLIANHIKWHTNPDLFRCGICQKNFNNQVAWQKHSSYHAATINPQFRCDICSKTYAAMTKLKRHILSKHAKMERTMKCSLCDKCFRFKEHLNKHIQIKHGDSPCICEVCAKLFRSEMALRLHMKTHAPKGNQPKVQCETCGAWLCNRYGLKTHMLLHTSKPQKCKICGKFSPTPNALRVHMNNIHRERTHQCHLCDKKFKNDAVLKGHIAVHTGERPFNCSFCPQTFVWRQDMYNHRKKFHPDEWSQCKQTRVTPK